VYSKVLGGDGFDLKLGRKLADHKIIFIKKIDHVFKFLMKQKLDKLEKYAQKYD